MNTVRLICEMGVHWGNNGANYAEHDLIIYCTDGALTASQVQLAAASIWLKQLLHDIVEFEDNRIKTIIIPFVTRKQMQQVLELICGGSVVLKEDDITSLVEISSLLGCIGDMLKEPVSATEAIIIQHHNSVKQELSNNDSTRVNVTPLEQELQRDKSVEGILQQIHTIQHQKMQRMEEEEAAKEKKDLSEASRVASAWGEWNKEERDQDNLNTKPEPLDSDDFIVSDDEFEDSDYEGRGYTYKRRKKIRFDFESFDEALLELGESSSVREGASVMCGLCDKTISMPEDRKVKARISFFKKNHYDRCLRKRTDPTGDSEDEAKDVEDEEDCLMEVYKAHVAMKEVDNFRTAQGRRKADVPPIETIRSFLTALGGATIVSHGHKIKCGLCENKLRVNIGRTIMGNIRYFERTHLLRCPIRIAQAGKPTELISENFLPGRTPVNRVLKNISVYDFERGVIVSQLVGDKDNEFRRPPGRPRKDEEWEPVLRSSKRDYYMSKRKQSLAATTICFSCNAYFETSEEAQEHFSTEHPDLVRPYYCLACQEYFKTHSDVLEHLDNDHNYKSSYNCPFCDKEDFLTQSKLNRHMAEEHPDEEMSFTCTMCTKGFSSFHALKSHQKTHTQIEPNMMVDPKLLAKSMQEAFTCRFCSVTIVYGKQLDEHIRADHMEQLQLGEHAYTCLLCVSPPAFDEFYHYENHLSNHGIVIDLVCRFCLKTNFNRNKYIEHFKTEHPGQPLYECPRYGCNKTFLKKQRQQDHIILHRVKEGDISEDMKKLCMECGKVFFVRKKLEQHVRLVHGGVGLSSINNAVSKHLKHQCHLCASSFSSNALLQGHIRKHENNPCFMCDHCGKGFYRKDRLAVHTRSVHLGQKNFQCNVCEKKFIDSYKLRRHMKTHTTGRASVGATAVAVAVAGDPDIVDIGPDLNDPTVQVHQHNNHQTVSIVAAPAAVSYETIGPDTIIRKLEQDGTTVAVTGQEVASAAQHVTIQQISSGTSGGPTILQLTTQPGPPGTGHEVHGVVPHIGKRTTIQNLLKFEGNEVVEDPSPVDFTQSADTKIHSYIINTQTMYQT